MGYNLSKGWEVWLAEGWGQEKFRGHGAHPQCSGGV